MQYKVYTCDGYEEIEDLGCFSDKTAAHDFANAYNSAGVDWNTAFVNELYQADEVWPIVKRKLAGIDCTEEESCIIKAYIRYDSNKFVNNLFPNENEYDEVMNEVK